MPCISMFYGIMVYMYNSGKEHKIKSSVNVKLSHFFCNSASLSIVPLFSILYYCFGNRIFDGFLKSLIDFLKRK